MDACCCRAFAMPAFRDAEDFFDEIRRIYVKGAFNRLPSSLDAIKTGQLIVPLPADWNDWPEDAKTAIPKGNHDLGGQCLYATCKMLDREEGRCMIHDARPNMCRSYAVVATRVNESGKCQFTHCDSCKDGQCKPAFLEQP